jgi:hypothetical protein
MMAAFGSYPIPAIVLNKLHEVSYLHASTIVPTRRAVKFFAVTLSVAAGAHAVTNLHRPNSRARKCPSLICEITNDVFNNITEFAVDHHRIIPV